MGRGGGEERKMGGEGGEREEVWNGNFALSLYLLPFNTYNATMSTTHHHTLTAAMPHKHITQREEGVIERGRENSKQKDKI